MAVARDPSKPFVRIRRDFRLVGETTPVFTAGEGVYAYYFQQVLEEHDMLDRKAHPRPPFECMECGLKVKFRMKGSNTSSATFVRSGPKEAHKSTCLFSKGAKAVREAQQQIPVPDRGDPTMDYPNVLTAPAPRRGSASVKGGDEEDDEEIEFENDAEGRTVRYHRSSLLKRFCARYASVVDKFSDDEDEEVTYDALKKMSLSTDNPDIENYRWAFWYFLAKTPSPQKKGNRIWYFGIDRAVVCKNGFIIEAKDSAKSPGIHGVVAVRMPPKEVAGSQLLADLKESGCLYVYGTVAETDYKERRTRLVVPKHLSWVTAATHPWFEDWDFPIEDEQRTVDEVLAGMQLAQHVIPPAAEQPAEVAPTVPVQLEDEEAIVPERVSASESQVTEDTIDLKSASVTTSTKPSTAAEPPRETNGERGGCWGWGWLGKLREVVKRMFS